MQIVRTYPKKKETEGKAEKEVEEKLVIITLCSSLYCRDIDCNQMNCGVMCMCACVCGCSKLSDIFELVCERVAFVTPFPGIE